MSLAKTDVERIAWLARLKLNEEDISEYAQQLSRILDFVNQMNLVDTTDILPMAHPLNLVARLRQDVVTEKNQREEFQAIAPLVEAGLYLVPKVIE